MSKRAAAAAASAAVSQSYVVSDDEDYQDLDELNSDDEGEGDVKPPKGILHGALRPPRHVTMSTVQLHSMIHNGTLNLCPEYQRDVVWPVAKMEGLIQSLFLNYYVPPIIFAVMDDPDSETGQKRVTIDGKQRCTSVAEFIDGKIAYAAPNKKRYFYRKPASGRGELLPTALKNRFDMISLVGSEYDDIPDQTQRDIFQRVQLGVALSSAEKLQAIASPWSTWISEMNKKYVTEPGTLNDLIRWDASRGKPFQSFAAIAMWCYEPRYVKSLSPKDYKEFLDRSDPPDEGFKRKIEKALSIFVKIASEFHHIVFHLPTIQGKGPRAPVAPVEIWFIGYVIFQRMNVSSLSGLAQSLREMRIYAREREKDLFTNAKVIKTFKNFLEKAPIVRPGPNEQVAAVEWENEDPETSEFIAQKRKREVRENDEDPDYRGSPVKRGSKSDIVGQTRSNKKTATASSNIVSTAPSRLATKARGAMGGSASPTTAANRPTLPTIPTQRPPPNPMDAQLPTPALSASFGQPSPTLQGAPPPYDPRVYPQQQQQQQRYNAQPTQPQTGYRSGYQQQPQQQYGYAPNQVWRQ